MIKFSKWMYELGYKAALKDVLSAVDGIPAQKPRQSDFEHMFNNNAELARRMDIANATYYEREYLKKFMHKWFDPNYEPEPLENMHKKDLQ